MGKVLRQAKETREEGNHNRATTDTGEAAKETTGGTGDYRSGAIPPQWMTLAISAAIVSWPLIAVNPKLLSCNQGTALYKLRERNSQEVQDDDRAGHQGLRNGVDRWGHDGGGHKRADDGETPPA